jgi:uncharacterized membrane protein HdeD (DUF308 family)
MANVLLLNWWTLALRGLFAILFSLIAFFLPVATLYALNILFGAYALAGGMVSLMAAVQAGRRGQHWRTFLWQGLAGLAAAALTVLWPFLTLVVLVYIIAAWAVLTGVFEVAAAVQLRRYVEGEWLLALSGVASILFGMLLFGSPGTGAIVLTWWMGTYVFLFGLLMLGLAFRLRRNPQGIRRV